MKNKNLLFTVPFLTIFYYVQKRNRILRKYRGEGFEKSYVLLHRDTGEKNCQNHPHVINERPLTIHLHKLASKGITSHCVNKGNETAVINSRN